MQKLNIIHSNEDTTKLYMKLNLHFLVQFCCIYLPLIKSYLKAIIVLALDSGATVLSNV